MTSEYLNLLKPSLDLISLALEIVGVIIIIYAAVITLIYLIKAERKNPKQAGHSQSEIKLQFTIYNSSIDGLGIFHRCRYNKNNSFT